MSVQFKKYKLVKSDNWDEFLKELGKCYFRLQILSYSNLLL